MNHKKQQHHTVYSLVAIQCLQLCWCLYLLYFNPKHLIPLIHLLINISITIFLYIATALSVQCNNVEIFLLLDWCGKFSDMFFITKLAFPWMKVLAETTCCRCTRCLNHSNDYSSRWPPVNSPLVAERLELFLILCVGESLAAADPKGKYELEQQNDGGVDTYFWSFIPGVIMISVCNQHFNKIILLLQQQKC